MLTVIMAPTKSNSSSECKSNFTVNLKPTLPVSPEGNNLRLSKSRWKILAQAIRKKGKYLKNGSNVCDKNTDLKSTHILRYPTYDLISCQRCSDPHFKNETQKDTTEFVNHDERQRTWYNIAAKGYSEISLKVSE